MTSLIWYFLAIFAIDAIVVFGSFNVPRSQLTEADTDLIQAFQGLLQKALGPEGTYHRHLLISAGIVPAPANYVVPKDYGSGKPEEKPLTEEIYEHFKRHIADIITSEEKLFLGINRLFKNHDGLSAMSTNQETVAPLSKGDSTRTCSTKGKPFRKNTKMSTEFMVQSPPDSSCDESTEIPETNLPAINEERRNDGSEQTLPTESASESSIDSGSTSEYLKFLTDGMSASMDDSRDVNIDDSEQQKQEGWTDQISQSVPPLTQEYIGFLRSNSLQFPVSTEKPSTELERDGPTTSSSTEENSNQKVKEDLTEQIKQSASPLSREYIEFLKSESTHHTTSTEIPTPATSTAESEFTTFYDPVTETTTLYVPESKTEIFEPQPESETDSRFVAYSPVSGELLTVENVKLIDEPISSMTDELKYLLESSSQEESTDLPSTEQSYFQNEKRTEPVRRRHVKEVNHEGDSPSFAGPGLFLVRGTPGQDFPDYDDIPNTSFSCDDKKHIPGFYADEETKCQVFHVCWPGRRESFLCPIGTTFNQAILACDYWYYSNCSISAAYFDVNTAFKETELSKSGTTGPMVDTLINSQRKPDVKPEIVSSSKDIAELYEADVHFTETLAKHELSQIWRFLPIKAKVYIQPQPDLMELLMKSKSKRSKDGTLDTASSDSEKVAEDLDRSVSAVSKKKNIESVILKVLRNLALSEI